MTACLKRTPESNPKVKIRRLQFLSNHSLSKFTTTEFLLIAPKEYPVITVNNNSVYPLCKLVCSTGATQGCGSIPVQAYYSVWLIPYRPAEVNCWYYPVYRKPKFQL
jgi:hypothetical protein